MLYVRRNNEKKFKELIELFDEITNEFVRVIRFRSSRAFERFLEDFRSMRYSGYSWRYSNKSKKWIPNLCKFFFYQINFII